MQPYDILMLAVLGGATLLGVWKGMAWQVAALASVVVSAVVAVHGSAVLAPYFSVHEPWNRFLAMLVLYVVTAAAIWMLFHLVAGIIDRVRLREFDRQLGAIFGLAKGILYCVIITFFAVTLSESTRQTVLQSRSGDLIARGIRNANPILPEDIRMWLGKYIDELDEKLHSPPKDGPTEPSAPLPVEYKTACRWSHQGKAARSPGAVVGLALKGIVVVGMFAATPKDKPADQVRRHEQRSPMFILPYVDQLVRPAGVEIVP